MPSLCCVCNKNYASDDLSTIGNQSVCCLSCVGLLKANKKDSCKYCQMPVWKDNYYEIDNFFLCSEKCKNIIQDKLLKEKNEKYIKFHHYKEEKFYKKERLLEEKKEAVKMLEKNYIDLNDNNNETNEWNKNSFIQKEPELNEDFNNKDELKLLHKIEKNSHKNKEFKNTLENNYKKNEKESLIKNMLNYFNENKPNFHRKAKNRKNRKNKNIDKISKNFPNLESLNKNSTLSLNSFYLTENNLFLNKTSKKEDLKKEIKIKLKSEKKLYGKIENSDTDTCCIFNPIRKSENINIFKKMNYPIDSLNFPIDTLPAQNESKRDSTINCCFNCKKPILFRNSNIQKDFCSLICKNNYFKISK